MSAVTMLEVFGSRRLPLEATTGANAASPEVIDADDLRIAAPTSTGPASMTIRGVRYPFYYEQTAKRLTEEVGWLH